MPLFTTRPSQRLFDVAFWPSPYAEDRPLPYHTPDRYTYRALSGTYRLTITASCGIRDNPSPYLYADIHSVCYRDGIVTFS